MDFRLHSVLRTGSALLVVLLCVGVGGLLRLRGADEEGAPQATVPSPGLAPPSPGLPVVARPPAAQPPVGLPADTHLDTNPPRKTKSLDLVKNGWTYNCMECHKLLPARWHYDRPLNEHQDIKLEHGNNRFCLNCHHASPMMSGCASHGTTGPKSPSAPRPKQAATREKPSESVN